MDLLPEVRVLIVRMGVVERFSPLGGFGDVWKGLYNDRGVAIKALRVSVQESVKIRKVSFRDLSDFL